jgi:hypothetical protein
MEADHSNLFHEALVKVHDITTNKPLNEQVWQDVREVVDKALEEARRNDRADQSRKYNRAHIRLTGRAQLGLWRSTKDGTRSWNAY